MRQLLPIATTANTKVKFYPGIASNEDPNQNTRTFALLKQVNNNWEDVTNLLCPSNNVHCLINFVLEQGVQYAIVRRNFDLDYTGSDIINVEYFTKNAIEKKYLYGGGNRIKQIGYFDTNASQNYYKYLNPILLPKK
ncbi:MAG TPA: hypothetical protein VF677_03500, partial [Flavobacterium sp.]